MKKVLEKKYKENIETVRENIEKSCKRSGRDPEEVLLIAASKYADSDQVTQVMELGISDFGENRAQDLLYKDNDIVSSPVWHFIGHLQRNKVKKVLPLVEYIHSIDKLSTLETIDDIAKKIGKRQKVLVEVNLSGEKSKYGIDVEDLSRFLDQCKSFKNISLCGLMTIAPFTDDNSELRRVFGGLREALLSTVDEVGTDAYKELSMGMSNDYELAIEEGATMIRVGSSIFK